MEPLFKSIEVRVHLLSEWFDDELHFLVHNLSQVEEEFVVFHRC